MHNNDLYQQRTNEMQIQSSQRDNAQNNQQQYPYYEQQNTQQSEEQQRQQRQQSISQNQQWQQQQQQQQQQPQQQQQQHSGSMQIKNEQSGQLSTVKDSTMNDRDCLNDMLVTAKYLTDGFNVFTREASHRALHHDVQQILGQTHHEVRDLFNLLFEKGWYSLQAESTNQVAQAHQQFSNYQTQFPNIQSSHQ